MSNKLLQRIKKNLPAAVRIKLPRKVAIISIEEKESRELNLAYRDKNKPANVLSFLYSPEYGEIIVCPAVIRKEAKEQRNTYRYQMTWMIVHGIIHLAGIHHEKSEIMRKKFERIERSALGKLF
ncbi:MAG: rRNA maturation RNase YbeY [Candidatus Sungbacteria bacterium]|nr:rRNA maturation RNase YbeY [Candidatus Sungbacteria bacterium]